MNRLPNTSFLFSVACNDVQWSGSHTDLVMNSLLELSGYDERYHTEVLSRFLEDHPLVYADLLPASSIKGVELCNLIRSLWWEWYRKEGFQPQHILIMFVQCLQQAYPVVLFLPENIQDRHWEREKDPE